ncbi:hypothetical protein E2C01_031833 [Portunus trituberculatus]|uniref:Uncharacterized protein n=1 Tax=Portunus trituberculatus TaxID=210409 RepID=A0A5B7EZ87_PORTR|nr:hypothetical protein [Portunus trituberculatus]
MTRTEAKTVSVTVQAAAVGTQAGICRVARVADTPDRPNTMAIVRLLGALCMACFMCLCLRDAPGDRVEWGRNTRLPASMTDGRVSGGGETHSGKVKTRDTGMTRPAPPQSLASQ